MGLNPDISRDHARKYADALRQAINTPVQSFASDLKMMAAIELEETLDPEEAYVIGEIHDSVLMIVREEAVEKTISYVKKVMEKPKILDDFNLKLNVPIVVEAEVGPSLGETEEVE